jgi:hypothetical protein
MSNAQFFLLMWAMFYTSKRSDKMAAIFGMLALFSVIFN